MWKTLLFTARRYRSVEKIYTYIVSISFFYTERNTRCAEFFCFCFCLFNLYLFFLYFSRSDYEASSLCFLWFSSASGTRGAALYVRPVYPVPHLTLRHHNILIVHGPARPYIRPAYLTVVRVVIAVVEVIIENGGVSVVQILRRTPQRRCRRRRHSRGPASASAAGRPVDAVCRPGAGGDAEVWVPVGGGVAGVHVIERRPAARVH